MENFIKECEDWINKFEQPNQDLISRRDLQLKYYRLREDYENLGDMRSFVRSIFGEVTGRYLVMPKPKKIERVSFSIRGNRD